MGLEVDKFELVVAGFLNLVTEISGREIGDIPSASDASSEKTDDFILHGGLARALYRERRLRSDLLNDPGLFGEPAWDIMLELYVAASLKVKVSTKRACIAAAVPNSTALRWIMILEEKGWICRSSDPADRRRSFVALSAAGLVLMTTYLKRVSSRHK